MEKRQIVIIGAGPAGLMAATEAARLGRDVLVLEKNEDFGQKVCAEAVTSKILDKFPFVFHSIEKSFNDMKLAYYGKTTYFRRPAPLIHTINRQTLSEIQLDQAKKAGAEIRLGVQVTEIGQNYLITKSGDRIKFEQLIGADGNKSIVRKFLKIPIKLCGPGIHYQFPQKYDELEIHLNTKKWGYHYAWVFPHNNYTSVGTGYPIYEKAKPFVDNLNQLCEKLGFDYKNAKLKADLINADFRGYQFGNIYLAGEASGLISSLTGEGIYNALIMGQEIPRQIVSGKKESALVQARLRKKYKHEKLIRLYYKYPSLISLLYKNVNIAKKFK